MTLSGVTRDIAKAIVKHRQAIGRFRKIEDLALVGGIGADNLDKIRGEICVKNNSCSSSRAQSFDSLKSPDVKIPKLVDVNRANVFELQCVNGMTQEMAANIVHHRNKRGPFKKIDDLIKVRAINHPKLSSMCHQLTINDDDDYPVLRNLSRTTSASEVSTHTHRISNGTANGTHINGITGTPTRHRKTNSAPVKLQCANGSLPSAGSLADIFDLLSAYSYRPIPEEEFRYSRNGRDAFRIATWNLHEFTYEKAQNLGVREVICRTILENRWSIVCVQDIQEEDALELICEELNAPKLRKVCELRTNSYEWKCLVIRHSRLAYIYDAHSGGIGVELVELNKYDDTSSWSLAEFSIGLNKFRLLNVEYTEQSDAKDIEDGLADIDADLTNGNDDSKKNGNKQKHTDALPFVLGDLTHLPSFERKDFKPIVPLHTNTACAHVNQRYADNILIATDARKSLTGSWGMVRTGLTHLAIPNGWSWGGPVSPHCPLWVEIYVNAPLTNGF